MPVDLLLYIVIAVVMIFWLRNTLGTRHGEERDRSDIIEQLKNRQAAQAEADRGKIVDISDGMKSATSEKPVLENVAMEGGASTAQEIIELTRIDPTFEPKSFISNAKEAFPMIVESFARGDLPTLKMLLSDGVYATFEQAIEARRHKGETLLTDVMSVRECRILGVRKIDRMAYIKLRFIADECIAIKDREGNIVSGNPDRIISMNDVWTFGKDLKSKDPTWYLFETSDDVVDEHPNPVPDSQLS